MIHTVGSGLNSVRVLDRDRGGRFAPGNRGGPGNPFAREMAAFRAIVFRVVQPEDVEKAVRKLVELAREGHFPAIKLLLLYTLGKPTAPLEYPEYPDDVAAVGEGTASPSTNGDGQLEGGGPSPSTNGDCPDDIASPSAANDAPSTNGPPRPTGGNLQKKRLLTASLRPKTC